MFSHPEVRWVLKLVCLMPKTISKLSEDDGKKLDVDMFATPETPTSPRITDYQVNSNVKTPTFDDSIRPNTETRHKRREPRRQRAGTPHPAKNSGDGDSATTSPQTTPERSSKGSHRRRHPRNPKRTRASTESEISFVSDSPLARKSKGSSSKAFATQLRDHITLLPEKVGEKRSTESTLGAIIAQKPLSPTEALTMKIDYPSFQTTEILEFEPHSSQEQSPQAAPQEEPFIVSSEKSPDGFEIVKAAKKAFKPRNLRRSRPKSSPTPPEPKHPVEKGTRPALALLFERYGMELDKTKRPFLQFSTLHVAAQQKFPEIDIQILRAEFRNALYWDNEHEWPEHEILVSPIDFYFSQNEGVIQTFEYDPKNEATVEFFRLALEGKWISGVPVWDANNWSDSLKAFRKAWESEKGKEERLKFRKASFREFDQVPIS